MNLLNPIVEKEFALDERVYDLLLRGIKLGLKDFYDQKEKKAWPFIEYPTSKITFPWIRIVCINNAIDSLTKESPDLEITSEIKRIAGYEYILLTLEKENIKITISSVDKAGDLPEASEYRADLAAGNDRFNPQETLFEVIYDELLPKSLVVTYNGKKGAIPDFIRIGATTSEQNTWIYEMDLSTRTTKTTIEKKKDTSTKSNQDTQKSPIKLQVNVQRKEKDEVVPLTIKENAVAKKDIDEEIK